MDRIDFDAVRSFLQLLAVIVNIVCLRLLVGTIENDASWGEIIFRVVLMAVIFACSFYMQDIVKK
jgi:uncharacterized protein YqhQ